MAGFTAAAAAAAAAVAGNVTESHLFVSAALCGICVINAIGLCLIMKRG